MRAVAAVGALPYRSVRPCSPKAIHNRFQSNRRPSTHGCRTATRKAMTASPDARRSSRSLACPLPASSSSAPYETTALFAPPVTRREAAYPLAGQFRTWSTRRREKVGNAFGRRGPLARYGLATRPPHLARSASVSLRQRNRTKAKRITHTDQCTCGAFRAQKRASPSLTASACAIR